MVFEFLFIKISKDFKSCTKIKKFRRNILNSSFKSFLFVIMSSLVVSHSAVQLMSRLRVRLIRTRLIRKFEKLTLKVLIKNFRRPIPKITYHDAISLLSTSQQFDTSTKRGLNKQMEFELVKKFKGPVFVLRYPSSQKPFYMRRPPNEDYVPQFILHIQHLLLFCEF